MVKKVSNTAQSFSANGTSKLARSFAIAGGELTTGREYSNLISALISDMVQGKIAPPIVTATCNGVGKLLKMVELQHKYGGGKPLQLSGPML